MREEMTKISRRRELENLSKQSDTHAGLWLDKYIRSLDREDTESRRKLVEEVSDIKMPPLYTSWFERWKKVLEDDLGAHTRIAETQGRMVVGLGAESVLETFITLHHTFGVPTIPGSALKGVCAHYANQHLTEKWKIGSDAHRWMFGDTTYAGIVTFYDALPLPNQFKLHPDVMTVHHKEYYGDGNSPPADWDSPNPVPFLSVKGKFLIALGGPKEWVEAGFTILEHALMELGIGAKTSSGYGRMEFVREGSPSAQQSETGLSAQFERWESVQVTRNPGTGELRAQHCSITATASGTSAQQLFACLPESAQQQLKEKRRIVADVEVETLGNQRTIKSIIPKE